MNGKQHVFSSFDSWVIDVAAAFGIALLIAGAVMAFLSALIPSAEGQDRGGAGVVLLAFVLVLTLVRHRQARAKRDAQAAEEEEPAAAGGRGRKGSRG